MLGRLAQWNRGEGFATIRADWLARAAGLGRGDPGAARRREVSGRFEAIDEAGRLVLRVPTARARPIAAGDVFIDRRPSPDGGEVIG